MKRCRSSLSRRTPPPPLASAATTSVGSAEADLVVTGDYRTPSFLHNSMETHHAFGSGGRGVDDTISTQYIWGSRAEVAEGPIPPARQRLRVICPYMGYCSAPRTAPTLPFIAAELVKRTGRTSRMRALERR